MIATAVPSLPAAIILASGMSRRFGERNKLLAPFGGVPLVRRVVEAYVGATVSRVIVVVGFAADDIIAVLSGLAVTLTFNPEYQHGQSRALVRGLGALPPGERAVLIGVADQPLITSAVVQAVVDRYMETDASLVVPRYGGRRGNPVLFRADLFPELLAVEGDQGGRPVIEQHAGAIEWIDFDDVAVGSDIDTQDEYERSRDQRT